MGSEEIFNQFNRLEEKIETLISKCVQLEKENAELKNKVFDLDKSLNEKEILEVQKAEESQNLKSRIDSILEKISAYDSEQS